jgi:hypothetical protein
MPKIMANVLAIIKTELEALFLVKSTRVAEQNAYKGTGKTIKKQGADTLCTINGTVNNAGTQGDVMKHR